jgi:hypothetical protein
METLSVCHDAGFFSCCTVKLCRITEFFNKNKRPPETVDSSCLWGKYKDHGDHDLTSYFFMNPSEINQEVKDVIYGDRQFWEYKNSEFEKVAPYIIKYFSPSKKVLEYKDFLVSKYNIDPNKTISVFYRAHDKITETSVPSYGQMLDKINQVKSENKDHRIIVQSADSDFCNLILSKYPDSIVFEEIMKFDRSIMQELGNLVPTGKKKDQALIFLAIILLISKSNKIIINSGNIGLWIVLFRQSVAGVDQYLNGSWL